jgi:hypothetical protein
MPVEPHGEKRPRSVTANAVRVAKIAVGEADEEYVSDPPKKRVRRKVVRRTGRLKGRGLPRTQRPNGD